MPDNQRLKIVSEELSSMEIISQVLFLFLSLYVSEELSSMEMILSFYKPNDIIYVSEELSSMEIVQFFTSQSAPIILFQKNLVVWKCVILKGKEICKAEFQKNLVVWKYSMTVPYFVEWIFVSEELSSMEMIYERTS